jgi:hypothetical protein
MAEVQTSEVGEKLALVNVEALRVRLSLVSMETTPLSCGS